MNRPSKEGVVVAYTDDKGVIHVMDAQKQASEDRNPSPTHWPSIPGVDAEVEWKELRLWVEELKSRFPALDHHVIPACWWRHNDHVETLSALRDHERASFGDHAFPTGPMEWFRALRDTADILGRWTAELTCGALHQERPDALHDSDYDGWEGHCRTDQERREREEIDTASAGDRSANG